MNGLYHKDIGFPEAVEQALNSAKEKGTRIKLWYGKHAYRAAHSDRYGTINLPKRIAVAEAEAVEVEVVENVLTKVVFRVHYDEIHDLAVVVMLKDGFVKTVWLNRKDDQHRTLNTSKYTLVH